MILVHGFGGNADWRKNTPRSVDEDAPRTADLLGYSGAR